MNNIVLTKDGNKASVEAMAITRRTEAKSLDHFTGLELTANVVIDFNTTTKRFRVNKNRNGRCGTLTHKLAYDILTELLILSDWG